MRALYGHGGGVGKEALEGHVAGGPLGAVAQGEAIAEAVVMLMVVAQLGVAHVGDEVVAAALGHHKDVVGVGVEVVLADLIDVVAILGA